MKNKMLQLFLLLGLTIGLTGLAQAQTGASYEVNVPFDFAVSGKSFKAGDYSISFGVIRSVPSSFLIRSADGKQSAIVTEAFSEDVFKSNGTARIVFNKDGDDYTLTEIKTSQKNVVLLKERKKQKSAKVTGVEVALATK